MSKKKFKLDLNKQVISNLQAKQITGGGVSTPCQYHRIRFVSQDAACDWSQGNIDYHNYY